MRNDQYYMQLVLDLAKSTMPQTLPNPQVAAIIVNDGHVVGIGCHLRPGEAHAEVYAIAQAGAYTKNATLYVNLEPCAHYGKTPPCADAVINAGIKRVVIANLDPNPMVSGKGIAKLKQAGIDVEVGLLAEEAKLINEVFFHNILTQRPFVTLKVGMSLDGKIATKTNLSKWITGPEARKDAHFYRAYHSAILTGVNTIISDDPTLTPYLCEDSFNKPVRIILDRYLRTPLISRVVTDRQAPTWIYTTSNDNKLQQKLVDKGVKVIVLQELAIDRILEDLYCQDIYSVFIEGGEKIFASFIEAKLINQLITYISPQLIGSRDAKHFFAGNGFSNLTDNLHLKIREIKQLGNDIKIVSIPLSRNEV